MIRQIIFTPSFRCVVAASDVLFTAVQRNILLAPWVILIFGILIPVDTARAPAHGKT